MIRQLAKLPFRRAWTARIVSGYFSEYLSDYFSAFVSAVFLVAVTFLAVEFSLASRAMAQSLNGAPSIFDVRRSLPLEPDEESFHDFYINVGPEGGFKKGMYVTVVRQIPVTDPILNKQQATLTVNVAKLHVIHVERGITVARLVYEFTDEERPTLEYESVMIGDKVDPTSFTMEAPSTKKKKKVVENAALATEVVKVAVVNLPAAVPAATAPEASSATSASTAPVLVASNASPQAAAPSALATGPKTTSEQNPLSTAPSATSGKNASPASSAADMVRVPVPGSGPTK